MCNHYRADPDWRERTGEFSHLRLPLFRPERSAPRANVPRHIYPGGFGEILHADAGELVSVDAYWRFVPPFWNGTLKEWAKPSKPGVLRGKSCNNARGEKADTTAMFREAAKNGRCLIPAGAFYEWGSLQGGPKREYQFSPAEGGTLWLAGLYRITPLEHTPEDAPEGRRPFVSYTMVTKACGGDTGSIGHERQPVNLRTDQLADWMDASNPVASFTTELSPAGTFLVERYEKQSKD